MCYVNYISVKVPKNKFKDGSRSRSIGVPEGNGKDASEAMGTADHLTCLLGNVCRSRSKFELDMEQQAGSKLG